MHISGAALLTKSGYSQQFLMEVTALRKSGYDVYVLVLCYPALFREISSIRALRKEYEDRGLNIYILPSLFFSRMIMELLYYPVIWLFLSFFILVKGIRCFHCHNEDLGFTLLIFKAFRSLKLFIDMHGVSVEEKIYRKSVKEGSISHRYANMKEKAAFRFADVTFCVSEKMIQYFMAKHHLPRHFFALTRSTFDPDIFREFSWDMKKDAKRKLDLQSKHVVLYMGHKKLWQRTDDVIHLYVVLKKQISDLFIVILTDDIEGIEKAFKRSGVPEHDFLVRHVPHEEVPLYSYAADIAIVIRDDSIVNRVASPVKVSESLASGAALLGTDTVGDLPSLIEKYGIGFVIKEGLESNLVSFLEVLFADEKRSRRMAEQCRSIAEKEFSVWNTVKVFGKYYGA